ncbi:gas vesicle protein [Streptomyces sp. NPDC090119]|uniref:gas vesicle protein n=1 Tax=Streptomyces sp. NPDC090119 TaxID=3365951 RepID=UPI003821019B
MSESFAARMAPSPASAPGPQGSSANLADILERVLDKGVVIAGDIQINLLDIELLTIKLRLLVASVDKAKEMGIDWWEHDPSLSSRARRPESVPARDPDPSPRSDRDEIERLRAEVARLREQTGGTAPAGKHGGSTPSAEEDE